MGYGQLAIFWAFMVAGLPMALLILYGRPRMKISIFRYQLWELRDRTTDAILSGALPSSDLVLDLKKRIEQLIRQPEHVGLIRWKLLPPPPEFWTERFNKWRANELAKLSAAEMDEFSAIENELYSVVAHYMLTASLMGQLYFIWIVCGIWRKRVLNRLSIALAVLIEDAAKRAPKTNTGASIESGSKSDLGAGRSHDGYYVQTFIYRSGIGRSRKFYGTSPHGSRRPDQANNSIKRQPPLPV